MSTLKTNTLSNVAGTASTAIENAINGSAKAWVNFNGTGTVAIRASYNVSSITDQGTGVYRVNFTNALQDANYSQVTMAGTSGTGGVATIAPYGFTNTINACNVTTFNTAYSALIDIDVINVAIFR